MNYDVPVYTPTSDLTASKLHWNSVLYTRYGKYLIVDVKNLYLKNPTKKEEYYKTAVKIIPQYIIDKHDLNNNQSDGYIYVRVRKVMYALVQTGIISHKVLKEHLKPYGYAPSIITQGLWKNQDRDITFTLVVDYFVIKYSLKKGRVPPHLITPIKI